METWALWGVKEFQFGFGNVGVGRIDIIGNIGEIRVKLKYEKNLGGLKKE